MALIKLKTVPVTKKTKEKAVKEKAIVAALKLQAAPETKEEKLRRMLPVLKVEKKPSNIFGILPDTMLLTDLGRLTKAGFILEFHKLRNAFCVKLFDEVKALLDNKAFMVSEQVHLDFLLKSFDRTCISVYGRKDKLTIEEMKKVIIKTMRDIQSNIVTNIITILPDL